VGLRGRRGRSLLEPPVRAGKKKTRKMDRLKTSWLDKKVRTKKTPVVGMRFGKKHKTM